jgi:hypothetical protein
MAGLADGFLKLTQASLTLQNMVALNRISTRSMVADTSIIGILQNSRATMEVIAADVTSCNDVEVLNQLTYGEEADPGIMREELNGQDGGIQQNVPVVHATKTGKQVNVRYSFVVDDAGPIPIGTQVNEPSTPLSAAFRPFVALSNPVVGSVLTLTPDGQIRFSQPLNPTFSYTIVGEFNYEN